MVGYQRLPSFPNRELKKMAMGEELSNEFVQSMYMLVSSIYEIGQCFVSEWLACNLGFKRELEMLRMWL